MLIVHFKVLLLTTYSIYISAIGQPELSHIDLGFTDESFDEMKYLIEKDQFNEDNDDDDPPTENKTLLNDFRHWHLSSPSNTTSSTTSLLKILRKHPGLSFLPSDVRSLVKSMRKVVTIPMEPGHYYQFGLRSQGICGGSLDGFV